MQKSNELLLRQKNYYLTIVIWLVYFNVYQYLDTGRFVIILFKNNIKVFELTMN